VSAAVASNHMETFEGAVGPDAAVDNNARCPASFKQFLSGVVYPNRLRII
jgi:hypothetical protein